jgi:hypothetical protein
MSEVTFAFVMARECGAIQYAVLLRVMKAHDRPSRAYSSGTPAMRMPSQLRSRPAR